MRYQLVAPTHRIALKLIAALGSMAVPLAGSPAWSQAAHTAAEPTPELGRVEFENESMTVIRMRMTPRARTPMHDIASPRLVIWITEAHLRDTAPDGSTTDYDRPAGAIDWITPRRHMGENLSDQDLDFLVVIPKVPSSPGLHAATPP
jgi:hypothetical protein